MYFLNDWNSCASTHSDFLAKADLCQDLLYALTAPHLPDCGFHRLVGDWPIPSLKLIPNGALKEAKQLRKKKHFSANNSCEGGIEIHTYAKLTQRHKHQQRWKREAGPRCYLGSSCTQSLGQDNKSSRVGALVCSLVWKKKCRHWEKRCIN